MAKYGRPKKEKQIYNNTSFYLFDSRDYGLKFIKKFVLIMMVLLLFVNCISWINYAINNDKFVYNKCVERCSYNQFEGYQIGIDGTSGACSVNQIDHTDCISDCNDMYMQLKNK